MLSDDITGGLSRGINAIGAMAGGALRGFVIGGAVAIGLGALIVGIPAAIGALTATGIGAGILAGGAGMIAGASTVWGSGAALTAAEIGAAVIGIGSIIPSASQWFGLKDLMRRRTVDETTPMPIDRSPSRSVTLADNPLYEPGRGAQMMQKGDAAQSAYINR